MAKFKPKAVTKYHEGDKYTFIGGKAKVPRFRISGAEVYITHKEFRELIKC